MDALCSPNPCLAGDADGDGDVDLADYSIFAVCLSGPGTVPAPMPPPTSQQCLAVFDLDGDLDVDLGDFALFVSVFTG
jgi:hypothetical protein